MRAHLRGKFGVPLRSVVEVADRHHKGRDADPLGPLESLGARSVGADATTRAP